MRIFRILILTAVAASAAACASDRKIARSTPPAPYVLDDSSPFGVSHVDWPDGRTEIFVRLNETSSAERARSMAWYHAARLGRAREAETFRVLSEEAGMECKASDSDSLGVSGVGHPVTAAAVFVLAAVYILVPKPESYEAFPSHTLDVRFADGKAPPGEGPPVSVPEILAALGPRFGPEAALEGEGAPDPKAFPDAQREDWARIAEANEKVCAERAKAREHRQEEARTGGGMDARDSGGHDAGGGRAGSGGAPDAADTPG